MRTTLSKAATALSLAAFFRSALADEPRPAMVLGVPDCAADGHGTAKKIWESGTGDCHNALYAMYAAGATTYHPPTRGCNSVAKAGNCEVFLCGTGNGFSTISAGAISLAVLDIHAYCRLDGRVGGRSIVYNQEGDGKKGNTMVQLGEIHKDELKRRGEEEWDENDALELELREAPRFDEESSLEARRIEDEPALRHRRRQLADIVPRSDPNEEDPNEVIDNADGVNEGEEHEVSVMNRLILRNEFIGDIRAVVNQPNPNWRNTALVERQYRDAHRDRDIVVTMAYLAEDQHDLRDLRFLLRDNRLNDLITAVMGGWEQGGFRTIFSNHIYRTNRNNRESRVPLGQVVINVQDRIAPMNPPLAILPGGSRG